MFSCNETASFLLISHDQRHTNGRYVVSRTHMKLTAVKNYCSDLGNPPQRAFAIRTSMNRVILFICGES